jgi:hypothetical protein
MRSVFPDDRLAFRFFEQLVYSGAGAGVVVYLDEAATTPAAITTYPAGVPIAGSRIVVGDDSLLPEFYGPEDVLVLWAAADGDTQTYRMDARFADRVTGATPVVWSYSGSQYVRAGAMPLYLDADYTFVGAIAGVGTPPQGAALVVDVHLSGTTIFGDQSARPTIAADAHSGMAGIPTVTVLPGGGYLTVDVDQVGSTVPGSDLSVVLSLRRKG